MERKEQNKRRVKFARRVRQRGVETEFTLERRSVRARSKGEERRRRHSGEPLGNLDALRVRATRDESGVRFRTGAHLGQSKIEQLVLRVYSPVARCKQILFKSTELNRARLTRGRRETKGDGEGGAERRGAGPPEPGWQEGKKKKAEVIPALSLACVTYLRRCVLWEPATECIRRPQRARESRSECERDSGGGSRGRRRAASNLCSLSGAGEQESTGGHGDMTAGGDERRSRPTGRDGLQPPAGRCLISSSHCQRRRPSVG